MNNASPHRVMMGFVISAALAIPLGLLAGCFRPIEAFIEPLVGFVRYVLAPAVFPGILETMRVMAGWAWTYLVVAELVAANSGLGFRILKAQRFLATADVFAGIVVIGLLGLATDLAFKFLSARLVPWAKP